MKIDRKSSLDFFATILIIVCCVIWGFQQITIKWIASEVTPIMQATIRSIGATLLVYLWFRFKKIPIFQKDKTFVPGLLAGVLFAVEFLCLYSALEYTNSSRAIIFLYLAPFIVCAILAVLVPSERLNRIQIVGLVLAFFAVGLAFQEALLAQDSTSSIGDLLALLAALAWALTTVVVRVSALGNIVPERTLLYQLAISSVVMVIYCMLNKTPIPYSLTPVAFAALGFQTLLVAAISYLAWFWLLRNYQATKISSFGFLTPIFGVGFSVYFLDETLSPFLVMAAIGVIVGIYMVNQRRFK